MVANIVLWVGYDILWYTHYELNHALAHEVDSLWGTFLRWLVNRGIRDTCLCEEVAGAKGSVDIEALRDELACRFKHLCFLLRRTDGEEYILLWYAHAYGKHRGQKGSVSVLAEATHLTRRGHVHTDNRVGLLQTVEGELRCLDTHIVEIEEVLAWFLHWETEHDTSSYVDEVDLQHFRYEWERA